MLSFDCVADEGVGRSLGTDDEMDDDVEAWEASGDLEEGGNGEPVSEDTSLGSGMLARESSCFSKFTCDLSFSCCS